MVTAQGTAPDPDDPILHKPGPHETAGVLRVQRAGWPGNKMVQMFNTKGQDLIEQIKKGIEAENEAHRMKLGVHDALMPKGTT